MDTHVLWLARIRYTYNIHIFSSSPSCLSLCFTFFPVHWNVKKKKVVILYLYTIRCNHRCQLKMRITWWETTNRVPEEYHLQSSRAFPLSWQLYKSLGCRRLDGSARSLPSLTRTWDKFASLFCSRFALYVYRRYSPKWPVHEKA